MVWLGIDGFSGFELSGEVELTLIEDAWLDRWFAVDCLWCSFECFCVDCECLRVWMWLMGWLEGCLVEFWWSG